MGSAEDLFADLGQQGHRHRADDPAVRAKDNWLNFKMASPDWKPQALGDSNHN